MSPLTVLAKRQSYLHVCSVERRHAIVGFKHPAYEDGLVVWPNVWIILSASVEIRLAGRRGVFSNSCRFPGLEEN